MKKLSKHFIVYVGLTIFAWIFNFVYQLFAHGVTSVYHANLWMVMLAGAVFYLLLNQIPNIRHRRFYRLFTNLLNTSVAFLSVGMMLKGIIVIAGSSSDYIVWYINLSLIGFVGSIILFILMLLSPYRKLTKVKKELV